MADPKHPGKLGEEFNRQIVQPCGNGKSAADIQAEYGICYSTLGYMSPVEFRKAGLNLS